MPPAPGRACTAHHVTRSGLRLPADSWWCPGSVSTEDCSALAGAKVTEENNWLAGLVMNVVFLLGLFTFAIVLGGRPCVPSLQCGRSCPIKAGLALPGAAARTALTVSARVRRYHHRGDQDTGAHGGRLARCLHWLP